MADLRIITVVLKDGVFQAPFTNTLAAYGTVVGAIPEAMPCKLVSYATVNRAVVNSGNYYNLATPIGIFTIKKVPLFTKAI